ncbi:hypothetical protein N752_02280 [Desulforamulus aquiferis]|nr:hypothetical protein N752_02280 [Desulforamulus aquiferis]
MTEIVKNDNPGAVPGNPNVEPPGAIPTPQTAPGVPGNPPKRIMGQSRGTLESIKELGTPAVPEVKSNIHCVTIVAKLRAILFFLGKTKQQSMNM